MIRAESQAAVILMFFALTATNGLAQEAANGARETGRTVYETHCLVCHQADGGGVPMMQPELWQSSRINGPSAPLIRFMLEGSAGLAPAERSYSNEMPGFSQLSNQDLAAVLTFIRSNFKNDAPQITPSDIAAARNP